MAKSAILKVNILSDASKATAGMEKTSKAAGLLAKAGALAAGAFAADKIVDFGKKAVGAAGDLEQSVGAIDTVFKGNAGTMHKWAADAADDVGLTAHEFNELGTLIGTQLKNGGTAMDQLAPKTNELVGLGADLSAMFGGTTADAVGALSSALKGERDPIERFGVSLNQAAIDAKAAELGFSKVGGALSAEANQAATLALIMEQTADAHGTFAKESATLQGQQQRAAAEWGNITAAIGGLFLPAVTAVFGIINTNVLPAVSALVEQLGAGGLGAVLGPLAPLFDSVVAAVVPIAQAVGAQLGPALALLSATFAPLLPQVLGLVTQFSPLSIIFQVIGGLLPQLVPLIAQVAATLGTVLAAVIPLATELAGALVPLFAEFATTVLPLVVQAVSTVVGALAPLVAVLLSVLVPAVKMLLPIIVGVVQGILQNVVGVIQGVVKVITGVVSFVGAIFRGDWAGAWRALGQIVSGAVQAVVNLVQLWFVGRLVGLVRGALGAVRGIWAGAWNGIKSFFASVWSGMIGGLSGHLGRLWSMLGSIPSRIGSIFSGAGSWLLSAGRNIIQGLLSGAGQLLPKIGRFFLDMLPGWIVGPFKGALGIASPSKVFAGYGRNIVDGITVGVGQQERRAVAAVADLAGNLAGTGQRALDSAVTDLRYPERDVRLTGAAGTGGAVHHHAINVTIETGVGDPVSIGREVDRVLTRYRRTLGVGARA